MWTLALIAFYSLHSPSVFATNGQTVSVNDTFMFMDETGRITCRISFGDLSVKLVRWGISRSLKPSELLYTYRPSSDNKQPAQELKGRSDYEHLPDGNSTLIIYNVTTNEQGNYTCSVNSDDLIYPVTDAGEVLVVERLETPKMSVHPNPVREGNESIFLCTQKGNKSEDVHFVFNSTSERNLESINISQDNGILRIHNTSRFDEGNYTCRVRNIAGPSHWSEPVKLDVFYPPDSITITTSTNDSYLYADDNATVICSVMGGRPFASSVQWECGGLGSGNGTLTSDGRVNSFTAIVNRTWNNQNCSCLVNQWALPRSSEYVRFSISWPPTDPSLTFDPYLPWLENNTFTAQCQTTDVGNPACMYSWFKGNQTLQLQKSDNNITLHVTKDDNNKQLKCVLQNLHTQKRPARELNAYSDLNVQFSPLVTFTTFGQTISGREFENLTIECVAYSNPKAMKQQFVLIHDRPGGSTNVRAGENTWEIGPVGKEDAGTYTCHVTVDISHPEERNLTGQDQRTLVVYYLHINTSLFEQEVTENERAEIECIAEAVPQEVVFAPWIHFNRGETRYLNSTFQNHTRAVITFQSIQYNNAGIYRCKAGNSIYQGADEKTAEQHVIVRYTAKQPKHPVEGVQIYTGLGRNVSLKIRVDAYPKEVKFTWSHRNDNNITIIMNDKCTFNKDDCLESTYNITDVTMSDLGYYKVHANNSVLNGSDFHFTLIQREGPGIPSIIVHSSFATPISVEISWWANHNGGYTQTFSVQYREPGEDFKVFKSGIPDEGLNVLHHVRVTPLDPATTYQFQVTAHNGHNGETVATSMQQEFRTLLRPRVDNSTMRVSRYGSMAYLTWKRPEGAFDTQRIEQYVRNERRFRRATGTCIPPVCLEHRNMSTDVTSYNVSRLDEGKKYRFTIVLFYKGDIVQQDEFIEELPLENIPTEISLNLAQIAGGAAGGGAALIIIIVVIFVIISCRRKKKTVSQEINGDSSENSISLEELKNTRKNGFDNKGYSNDAVDTVLPLENDNVKMEVVPHDADTTKYVTSKESEHVTSNPPPGTDGLLYATVEFTEPIKNGSDKNISEKKMNVDSSCEYTDIDHRKNTGDTASEPDEIHVEEIPEYAAVDYSKKKKPSVKRSTRKDEEDREDAIPTVDIFKYAAVDHGKKKQLALKTEESVPDVENYDYAAVDHKRKKNLRIETEGKEEAVPNVENYEYAAVDLTQKKMSSPKRDASQADEEQEEEVSKIGQSEYAVVDYSKKTQLSLNKDAKSGVDEVLH